MKLLILLTSRQRGGVEAHALTIGTAAVRAGWEVEAAFPRSRATDSLIADFAAGGVAFSPLAIDEADALDDEPSLLHRARRRLRIVAEKVPHCLRIIGRLRRSRPDAVLLAVPYTHQCLAAMVACGWAQIPTAVVFHLVPVPHAFGTVVRRLYAWARARRQQWIAVSDQNQRCIEESFGVPSGEVLRIYNGVPVSAPSPETRASVRREVRSELGVAEDARLAVTVARLTRQKGHDYLVPAVPGLLAAFPELRFVWVGDGERREELARRLADLGAGAGVLFLGQTCDVHRLLDAADLFVFPTYYEGCPFAVLEAMARGLPVVASATSGIPEMLEDRVDGLLTPTGDSQALGEAIGWALAHPETMQGMAERATERLRAFSEERMVSETLAVLTRLATR